MLDVRPVDEYALGHLPGAVSRLVDGLPEWRSAGLPVEPLELAQGLRLALDQTDVAKR